MTERPPTRYAKTADGVHIAYQVFGDGPIDLLFVLGWLTHIERMWEGPRVAAFLDRLATFARVMIFDKRGVGLSDRVADDRLPSLEVRMDDARAVMDAAGSERAVVLGHSEGGPMATLFAATYPERTIGLVLFGTGLCWNGAPDYPWPRYVSDEFETMIDLRDRLWGTRDLAREYIEGFDPSRMDDEESLDWLADYMRNAASPGAANAFAEMNRGIDVRSALPAIHVPTLVLARDDDPDFPRAETEWIADQIRSARFESFPGDAHYIFWGETEPLLKEIELFVDQVRGQEADLDRMLATVMFTDIVDSTVVAAELGDKGWKDLVERHHALVRAMLGRFRGTEVDTAGDGFFATFDGPARAVRCAIEIRDAVRDLGIEIRAGIHTGEVETIAGKTGGIAVNVGARIASRATASEILVSYTVQGLVAGSGLAFEDAGEHELKGVPGSWHLYRVVA
jgi:pimeloyl-ACP methyl ester carboxylesterase